MNDYHHTSFQPHRARCLVLTGDVLESLDGVRVIANRAAPRSAGLEWSKWLASHGAHVTVAGPGVKKLLHGQARIELAQCVDASTHSLIELIETLPGPYDYAFQLARVPSLRPRRSFLHKIKAKEAGAYLDLDVFPNESPFEALSARWPTFGYDRAGVLRYEGSETLESKSVLDGLSALGVTSAQIPFEYAPAITVPDLKGRHIVITSGPTAEPLSAAKDVLTNFSSGRQGMSIAWILALCGAQVSLISGPAYVSFPADPRIDVRLVESSESMLSAVEDSLPADGFVAVAAVADFRAENPLQQLLNAPASVRLRPTPDILANVGYARSRPQAVIGFAAETADLEVYARRKLFAKGADVILANKVGAARRVSDSSLNQVLEVSAKHSFWHPLEAKAQVGLRVAHILSRLLK